MAVVEIMKSGCPFEFSLHRFCVARTEAEEKLSECVSERERERRGKGDIKSKERTDFIASALTMVKYLR